MGMYDDDIAHREAEAERNRMTVAEIVNKANSLEKDMRAIGVALANATSFKSGERIIASLIKDYKSAQERYYSFMNLEYKKHIDRG